MLERQWKPHTVLDTHTHGFAVKALVVQGEMWLTCGERTLHLLERDVPHDERDGPEGATYWVARRNR